MEKKLDWRDQLMLVNVDLQSHGKSFGIDSNCNKKFVKDFKILDS